ncbi:MAG: glycosyl hydrolase, partial [Acidobacteriota bacterium]
GESQLVDVWPDDPMGWGAGDLTYRFQWNFPIFFSPHDPNRLYTAAQVLFRSDDLGQSWTAMSGDLTRNDKSKQGASGGPITKDNTSVEYYATIFSAIESPHEAGVFWTGSDDGLIHISRDDGETWTNVTPPTLPEWTQINGIDAHPTEPGGLYVAGTRYKLDDFRPYLYKTTDYGATWTEIADGIAEDHFTRAIRADPDRPGLLYAGTERGAYVSFDDGGRWQPLQVNLPIVPITDLAVKEGDLIAATQGRGFWILDDLSPLHQIESGQATDAHRLYAPRTALRLPVGGFFRGGGGNAGTPAPDGVIFHYVIGGELAEEDALTLDILNSDGTVLRTFTRRPDEPKPRRPGQADDAVLDADAGAARFAWDLRHRGPETFDGMVIWNRFLIGPQVTPGTYRARLTVGEWSDETTFEVALDPRSSTSADDLDAQLDFLLGVRDEITATHQAIGKVRTVREQIGTVEGRLGDDESAYTEVREAIDGLNETLDAIEKALYQTQNESPQDPLNFPIRLNDKLAGVYATGLRGNFAPTAAMLAVRDSLLAAIHAELDRLETVWTDELPALDALVREHAVPVFSIDDEDATDDEATSETEAE